MLKIQEIAITAGVSVRNRFSKQVMKFLDAVYPDNGVHCEHQNAEKRGNAAIAALFEPNAVVATLKET